jgi:hypothetical protein
MFSTLKSMRGHKTAQVFTNGHGYDRFYPLPSKCFAGKALMSFIHDAGIPQLLISDNSGEQPSRILGTPARSIISTGNTLSHTALGLTLLKIAYGRLKLAYVKRCNAGNPRNEHGAIVVNGSRLYIPQLEGQIPEEAVT